MTLPISYFRFYFPEYVLKTRLLPNCATGFLDSLNRTSKPDVLLYYGAGNEARLATGIPRIAGGDSQEPCRTSYFDALRAWVEVASSLRLNKKTGHPNRMSCYTMERATRLELATSTLARWRSTR